MSPSFDERRENFGSAAGSDFTRRDFLKGSVAAGVVAGGSLGAFYFGYGQATGSPVRVGILGTGDQGGVLIGAINPAYLQIKAIADIRPYSVYRAFHGDHSSPENAVARPGLLTKFGWHSQQQARRHVKVYDDQHGGYEGLINNARSDGIEAVIIALPLHLHAPAVTAAMKAGLHVFTEPLMARTVLECKELARTARDTGRYLAVGYQRQYNILYADAIDAIRRGTLGQVHYVRAQYHRGSLPGQDPWAPPLPAKVKPDDSLAQALAKDLADYQGRLAKAQTAKELELWSMLIAQKKAQMADEILKDKAKDFGYSDQQIKDASGKPYDRPALEELIRWRLWERTGGGLMAELGSQQLDVATSFIAAAHGGRPQYPLNVSAAANRAVFSSDRDVEDHVFCILEYPAPGFDPKDPIAGRKKIGVQYASIGGNGFGGYGEIIYGSRGTYILEREQEWSIARTGGVSTVKATAAGSGPTLSTQASVSAAATKTKEAVSLGFTEELEHWAWCIRHPAAENQPRCGPAEAVAAAVIALTAKQAARQGQRKDFHKEWFDIQNDATPESPEGA